jgi:hypothetical protein
MKGGLLLNNKLENIKTIQEAVMMFQNKNYSTFQLLTNSSVSCITFKATLNPDITSPFIEIRSDIFGKPVNTLLFKFFPIKNSERQKAAVTVAEVAAAKAKAAIDVAKAATAGPAAVAAAKVAIAIAHDAAAAVDTYNYFTTAFKRGSKNIIEIADESELIKEYLLQLKIYQQTYNTISSAYEPVCPYPIHYETNLNKNTTIISIINLLENTKDKTKIISEIKDTLGYESTKHSYEELERREPIFKLGYVVMEFMEDFVPFSNLYKIVSYEEEKKVFALIAYELARLQAIGVIHGDLHLGNIMYNQKYKYITDDETSENLGRVLLIDFGRSTDKMASDIKQLNQKIYKKYGTNAVGEFNKYLDSKKKEIFYLFEFKEPYTFDYIYSKRLELTLKFRQTIINQTIRDINEFIKNNPTKIAINELEKFKNSNNFKLAMAVLNINSLYPQNFTTSNNNFYFNQFNYPFNKIKQKLFDSLNISKKLKIDKIKEKIPIEFYQDKDLGSVSNLPALSLINIDSLSKMSKIKNTKNLEKMSQLGFNTLKNLNIMFTKMFTKSKKQKLNEGRGKNKLYNYLQYHAFTKKLNKNIIRQLNFHSKKLKRLKSQKNKTLL